MGAEADALWAEGRAMAFGDAIGLASAAGSLTGQSPDER
jgi:hypothetical protein